MQNDPLWKLRHALAGVGLALLFSVPIAAVFGSALGEALGGSYGWRAGVYSALLLYVVAGAFVLFTKVARHETRPLSLPRVGLWLASLWLWPALWRAAPKAGAVPVSPDAKTAASMPAAPPAATAPSTLAAPAAPEAAPASPPSPPPSSL